MSEARAVAPTQMVSPQEAADLLAVDRETIFRWVKAGRLRASKLSPRIVRIRLADVATLLEETAL